MSQPNRSRWLNSVVANSQRRVALAVAAAAALATAWSFGLVEQGAGALGGTAFAQPGTQLERPAAMRQHEQEQPLTSHPYLLRFDTNLFEHGIQYNNGHFTVSEGGVYVISASAYIEGTTKRRIEVRVYGRDIDPNNENWSQQYVLEQTEVERETQHNSTVVGTISLKIGRGDRISIWGDPNNDTSKIAAAKNSNWVSICQINRER